MSSLCLYFPKFLQVFWTCSRTLPTFPNIKPFIVWPYYKGSNTHHSDNSTIVIVWCTHIFRINEHSTICLKKNKDVQIFHNFAFVLPINFFISYICEVSGLGNHEYGNDSHAKQPCCAVSICNYVIQVYVSYIRL